MLRVCGGVIKPNQMTVLADTIQNYDLDALHVNIRRDVLDKDVEMLFEKWKLQVVLRDKNQDFNLANVIPLKYFLAMQDFNRGYSDVLSKDSVMVPLKIVLGNIIVSGEDKVDVQLTIPAMATTKDVFVEIYAIDTVQSDERIYTYDLIRGNGADQLVPDCHSLFLMTAPTGDEITISDFEKTVIIPDYIAVGEACCDGMIEKYREIGRLWSDRFGYSQDIRVKMGMGHEAVAFKQVFPNHRIVRTQETVGQAREKILQRIATEKPDKYRYMFDSGMLGYGSGE